MEIYTGRLMKLIHILKLSIVFVLFGSLTACQSMNAAVGGYLGLDTDLEIEFKVDADINPDELDKASPLFIRMYELKTKKMMKKADFIEIYERDKEVLGADLVNSHKLKRFKPGDNRTEHFVLDEKTHYVALYAEFLEFKDAKYKLIIPVVANNVVRNTVIIRVSGNKLIFDQPIDEDMGDDYKKGADKAKADADKAKAKTDKLKKLF